MKAELKLSRQLRAMLEHQGAHVCPVESHDVSPGIPDINYCYHGKERWVECKVAYGNESPKIRPSQLKWIRERTQPGVDGCVWLVAYQTSTGNVYLVEGHQIIKLFTFSDWRKLCVATATIHNLDKLAYLLLD